MIKNECEIVRDLIPNYIENQINSGTKEFVEEHLEDCKECSEILNSLSIEKDKVYEEKEINFLKIYNRKMNILKITAGILAAIIVAIWIIFGINYIQRKKKYEEDYEKGKYVYDIINEVYNNINEIKNSKNYKLFEEYKRIDYEMKKEDIMTTLTIRKNAYFREETDFGHGKKIKYGIYFGDRELAVSFDSNLNYTGYETAYKPGTVDCINEIADMHKSVIECGKFKIKEEEKEGKEYYIITRNVSEDVTEEVWIDKESMMLYKVIYDTRNVVLAEHTYIWEVNNVEYEDIEVEGGYEKLHELLKEMTMN